MTNRIREVWVRDHRIDPYESELNVSIYPERVTPTTEVRGRLVGPRSAYARTLEVAYPLRDCQLTESVMPGEPVLFARVVVPEPSFWDPETPFLYEGPIELWEGGQVVDRVVVRHGLRTRGFRGGRPSWNGTLITLRGVARSTLTPEDAAALRQAGCNTLVAPVHREAVWEAADRLGFLVLGQLSVRERPPRRLYQNHPCVLGWLLPEEPLWRDWRDGYHLETPVPEDEPRELVLRRPAPDSR